MPLTYDDRHRLVVPRVPFASWLDELEWRQGQHWTNIGPTGQGKTTLVERILPRREFVCVLASKPRDDNLKAILSRGGYRTVRRFNKRDFDIRTRRDRSTRRQLAEPNRLCLWPRFTEAADKARMADEYEQALWHCFAAGGWTVYVDDVSWLCEHLGLDEPLNAIWQFGRSNNVTLVVSIQRPRFVPLNAYSMASHLCMWGTNDEEDLRRVGGLGGLPSEPIRNIVRSLPEHDYLWIEPRAKQLAVSRVAA